MRLVKYMLLGAAVASVAACGDYDGAGPRGPLAMVRFVNASPDAGAVNFRFVDELENLPTFINVAFRGSTGLHQQVEAGDRDVRIFFATRDVDSATVRLIDETITLDAGAFYTLVYTGTVAGDADELLVLEESIPQDPAAGSIAVRVLHAASDLAAVDVYAAPSADDPVANPVATFDGVAFGSSTAYATIPAQSWSGLYEFAVADAGGTAASFSASPNNPGAGATATGVSAQAGVRQSGSVLTAVVMPAAVDGSRAATASNTTPTVVMLLDNIPGT